MDLPKSDKSQNEQDELRCLREENARLRELLTQHGIVCEESAIFEPVLAPIESALTPPHFTPTTDCPVRVCSVVVKMSIPNAGSRPRAHLAIHRPALMSGSLAFAINLA